MRIAIISELMAGGVERVNYLLAKGLSKNGYDTLTISIKGIGKENIRDINFVSLNKSSGKKALKDIIRKLKDYSPDWVICCDHTSTVCALAYKKLYSKRTKVMFAAHSVYSSLFKYQKKRTLLLQHYIPKYLNLYNRCDAVVYVSEGVKEDFKSLYKVKEDIEHVIYNPVFEEIPKKYKSCWNTNQPLKIVTVGRLSIEKNQKLQIQTIAKLKESGYNAELYLYGSGDCKDQLKSLANELAVADQIHFMGFSKHISDELVNYDVFCLSSEFESFGNVIVEAMGVKLPVVSVDCPFGPKEILEESKYGILVDSCIESLTEAFKNIIENGYPKDTIELAYNRSLEFTLEKSLQEYEKIFNL